jgi:hypothetical protein
MAIRNLVWGLSFAAVAALVPIGNGCGSNFQPNAQAGAGGRGGGSPSAHGGNGGGAAGVGGGGGAGGMGPDAGGGVGGGDAGPTGGAIGIGGSTPQDINDALLNAPTTGGRVVTRTPPAMIYPACQR